MATTLTIKIITDVAKAVAGIDQVDKKTASMGDKLKGAATAIGGAFSVSKIKGWADEWIAEGYKANGALKNVKLVFGEAADGVDKWGEKAASSFGMTAAAADEAAAKVGTALRGYGMSQRDAATASEELVQRSADMAKVLGVDQAEVLAKVETAIRGRTAGLKDYGVQVEKGSSQTQILNDFMAQTADYAGRADTPMAQYHATIGDLSAQLGQALIPVINAVLPLLQSLGDWAKRNKTVFDAIVIVIMLLALAFGVASTAAGIFAVVSLSVTWPIYAVVGAIVALVAIVVLVVKYWSDLVGWFHAGMAAISGLPAPLQVLIAILGGPLAAAIVAVANFGTIWNGVRAAIEAVSGAISKVVGWAEKAAGVLGNVAGAIERVLGLADKVGGALSKVGGLVDKLNPFSHGAPAGAPAAAGVSSYALGAPTGGVVFAPTITITGDVGDPVLAGRRIVAALEAWTAANGRRRVAALVGP